jgi:Peptidase M15
MYLSEHFTLQEATTSDTAARKGINNSSPPKEVKEVLYRTATRLEKVRLILKSPIHINSWYRCPELNSLLGSKSTSQHILGEAVDFICPQYGSPVEVCKAIIKETGLIRFDQLILEHTWIHISWKYDPNIPQRGEVLSLLQDGSYTKGLTSPTGIHY